MDIELDDIPPYRVRPFRFPRRLARLCFGSSLAAHAAMLLAMSLTNISVTIPQSARAREAPNGDRHVVAVTFSVQMTNFATTPAHTQPSDALPLPSEGSPADPASNPDTEPVQASDPSHASSQPTEQPTAPIPDPTVSREERLEALLQEVGESPRPIALPDRPLVENARSAEPFDAPDARPPQLALTEPATTLIDPLLPELREALESPTSDAPQPDAEANRPSETSDPSDATPPAEPEPPTKPAEPSQPDPTPPRTTDASDDDDDRTADTYDENSVDQPIAFDKKVRPVRSYKSKRFGDKGTIRILVTVDPAGRLVRYEVIDDADKPRLLAAAIKALEASTFSPAMLKGKPVQSTWGIEYRF